MSVLSVKYAMRVAAAQVSLRVYVLALHPWTVSREFGHRQSAYDRQAYFRRVRSSVWGAQGRKRNEDPKVGSE